MNRSRITAAMAGVVLMAGLTACGSSGGGNDKGGGSEKSNALSPLAALRQASTQTEKQNSAQVEATTKMGTPNGTQTSTAKGAMDWSEGGITGEMLITQKGGAVSGSPAENKPMAALYTADAMYMNMGDEFANSVGKGAHWVKYDYEALAKQAGASGAFLKDQLQNNNPSRSVQLLMATGKVKRVGTETVRGEKTTRYSGTLKVSELARMQSQEMTDEELEALQKQLEAAGMDTEKIDLWINEEDLLVKKTETADTANGPFESTAFYTDYGAKVTVEVPAAGDTLDFAELSGAGM